MLRMANLAEWRVDMQISTLTIRLLMLLVFCRPLQEVLVQGVRFLHARFQKLKLLRPLLDQKLPGFMGF